MIQARRDWILRRGGLQQINIETNRSKKISNDADILDMKIEWKISVFKSCNKSSDNKLRKTDAGHYSSTSSLSCLWSERRDLLYVFRPSDFPLRLSALWFREWQTSAVLGTPSYPTFSQFFFVSPRLYIYFRPRTRSIVSCIFLQIDDGLVNILGEYGNAEKANESATKV